MKVRNVGSNQTEVHFSTGAVAFFSYETLVAAFIPGRGYLRDATKYSVTTSRHVNKWLGSWRSNIEEVTPSLLAAEVEGQIARSIAFGEVA